MTQATDVREQLDRLYGFDSAEQIEGFPESIDEFMERVVEDGKFLPDENLHMDLDLTMQERASGTRRQRIDPILSMGMMLGAALERDVPMDSDEEEAWRNGEFELPDK